MATQQAPDRTGDKRNLFISSFETSDFPSVIVGPSYYLTVTTAAGKEIRTERAPVVSLRTTLDGEPYTVLGDENVDYRFMAPRKSTVIGIDATEDGEKIEVDDLITLANESFRALLARTGPATVTADVDL